MANPIATAFVEVLPDTRAFGPVLQAKVNAAIRATRVTPLIVPITPVTTGGGAGAAALAAEQELLAGAQLHVGETAIEATTAERLYAQQIKLGAVDLTEFAIANEAAALAEAEVAAGAIAAGAAVKGGGVAQAEKGLLGAANGANIAKGALIGLSRITPVAVFGLGLAGTAAIAVGLGLKSAIQSSAEFEKSLNVLQATSGATGAEMEQISHLAKQLGADISLPATSALDAAVAMTELSKAGLSIADTQAAARGVLQLAAAAQIDVGQAATFAANELNAFGLSGDKATHVADLLAGASVAAQGSIADFAIAFQQAGTAANEVGLSVEQTTALLTELAQKGLTSSDAGTSLKVALLRLVPTTKDAAAFQKALGIELDKTKDIGEQLPQVIDQYKKSLQLLSPINRQAALTQIFGADAFRAASIIFGEGAEGLARATAATNKEGEAARLAEAQTRGLSGAFQGLKSNLETFGITLGDALKGPLTEVVSDLSFAVQQLNKFADVAHKAGEQQGFLGDALHKTKVVFKEAFIAQIPVIGQLHDTVAVVKLVTGEEGKHKKVQEEVTIGAYQLAAAEDAVADSIHRHVDEVQRLFAINPLNAPPPGFTDEDTQAAAKAGADNRTAAQKAADARVENAKRIQKAKKTADELLLQGIAPNNLIQAQLQARIDDNLQAELVADQAIEKFFEDKLAKEKGRGDRYTKIQKGLAAAHADTQSVLSQIDSNAKAGAKTTAKAIKDLIGDAQDDARLLIEAADLTPGSEDNISAIGHFIDVLQKQIASGKLDNDQLRAAKHELLSAQGEQANLIADVLQSDIDFRRSVIDLAIHKAEVLTPNDTSDEARLIQQAINADKKLLVMYKKAGKSKRDLVIQVENDILDLTERLNNLKDKAGGGFTLNDLWKSAAQQLSDFGSNISFNPMTPGENVQSVASNILDQKPDKLASIVASTAGKQIKEAETTNDILTDIRNLLRVPGVQGGTKWRDPLKETPGTAADAAKFAVAGVGGM